MASTIKQRLRRFNGTDYDTIHLETHANNVWVGDASTFVNPLNTDQLTLGMNTVYFTAYPSLLWCVDHLDGDYAYLGLYNCTEKTAFGSNETYSGSTIAAKCTTFLNNTIPNVAQYLENVTVHGVTNKVFIPSYKMFTGYAIYGDADAPTFGWPSASQANRAACVSNWSIISTYFWLSSPTGSDNVCCINSNGGLNGTGPSGSLGFRPEVKVRYKDSSSEPDTLDNVLDELKTSVSSGKSLIAAAVTDKGVETAATDAFATMADNISAIPSGSSGTRFGNGVGQISDYELYLCNHGRDITTYVRPMWQIEDCQTIID